MAAATKHALRAAGLPILDNPSHIVPIMVGDADRCKAASDLLLIRHNIHSQPINYPTVAIGTERLKWPREAGPFLAAVKLEGRLLVVLYQAAKGSVCC